MKATIASGNSATSLATDPEFLCHTWAWVHNRGDKPSSGLVGIVMALKMCRTLDIYGFQYSNYFSRFSRPHYYDWERPKKGREKVRAGASLPETTTRVGRRRCGGSADEAKAVSTRVSLAPPRAQWHPKRVVLDGVPRALARSSQLAPPLECERRARGTDGFALVPG